MEFTTTLLTVALMLAFAVPGFILIKTKAVKKESISAFAKVLMYVCQPCLSLYSFQKVIYSKELFLNMLLFAALSLVLQLGVIMLLFFIFRKSEDAKYRVVTISSVFGNVGFLGVPLLEALVPQYPQAVSYSAAFIVTMNLLSWTVGSFMLTGDKKYISVKKAFINPMFISLCVTLPLFFTKTVLPAPLLNSVTLLGRMTTPMCMLVLGMRFASSEIKEMFTDPRVYLSASLKLIAFPLLAFLVTHWLPVHESIKITAFILCCCPTASTVLSLAEIYDTNQKFASFTVLAATVFCIVTIPLLLLIL